MRLTFFLLAALVLTACASSQLRSDFDRSYERYNELVRWHDTDRAVLFFSSSMSGASGEWATAAKKAKVIDYRVVNVRYDAKALEGEVQIVFDYYLLDSLIMKSLTDKQKWFYGDENGLKAWKLRSPPPEFK